MGVMRDSRGVEMPINPKSTEPNFVRCPRISKSIWCIFGIGDGSGIHTGTTWSYDTPSTPITLFGQEGEYRRCETIWCIFQIDDHQAERVTTTWNRGTSSYVHYPIGE